MAQDKVVPACSSCPWRTDKHMTKHKFGFYTKTNLRRLWTKIRQGKGTMSCHMTDPSHPDHVACGAKPGSAARECSGAVILVMRELRGMSTPVEGEPPAIGPEEIDAYLARRKKGLTKAGLRYWLVSRIQFGGVPFFGDQKLPNVDENDKRISLPVFLEG